MIHKNSTTVFDNMIMKIPILFSSCALFPFSVSARVIIKEEKDRGLKKMSKTTKAPKKVCFDQNNDDDLKCSANFFPRGCPKWHERC